MSEQDLANVQQELNDILEVRVTELMAQVLACKEVADRIASTDEEIRRQQGVQTELEARLGGKNDAAIQTKISKIQSSVRRMKKQRGSLLDNLVTLKSELSND